MTAGGIQTTVWLGCVCNVPPAAFRLQHFCIPPSCRFTLICYWSCRGDMLIEWGFSDALAIDSGWNGRPWRVHWGVANRMGGIDMISRGKRTGLGLDVWGHQRLEMQVLAYNTCRQLQANLPSSKHHVIWHTSSLGMQCKQVKTRYVNSVIAEIFLLKILVTSNTFLFHFAGFFVLQFTKTTQLGLLR